jgi:hypothetical protein
MGKATVTATMEVTADCGHKFKISVIGLEPETDLVCPECGFVDHFNADQVADIQRKFDVALKKAAVDKIGEALGQSLERSARGKKNITYRPKR